MIQTIRIISYCALFLSNMGFAQVEKPKPSTITTDTIIDGRIVSKQSISPLTDSWNIKSLEDYQLATEMDQKWIEELYSNSLFDSIYDSVSELSYENVEYPELPTETLKTRLEILSAKTPFNIEYNPSLESVIKSYLKTEENYYSDLWL